MKPLCDQTDCLLYPDNIKIDSPKKNDGSVLKHGILELRAVESYDLKIGNVSIYKNENKRSELIMNFESYDLEVPIECLFCSYRKSFDMKSRILTCKTKNMLSS